jgi:Xaa-Pro aminopeptidase
MDVTTTPAGLARALPPFQTDFPAEEFIARRAKVAKAIGSSAVEVLRGAPATGAQDLFRQTNDFYYLSGIEVPPAYLLIDGATGATTIYLPNRDPHLERHEGPQLTCEDVELAKKITGAENIRPLDGLALDIAKAKIIHTPKAPAEGRQASRDSLFYAQKLNAAGTLNGLVSPEAFFRQRLESICPSAQLIDLSPVLDELRLVKSAAEIDLMRKAGRICAAAVVEAMKRTRPGIMEFHLAAVAEYVYLMNGARGGAYRSIVAAGQKNIWNTHYYRNNCKLLDGDLVLMDYAPDIGNYCSDIGRFWPVNGKYTPVQRELYGFMIIYHKVLLKLIRPGVMAQQILNEAAEQMTTIINTTKWSKPVYEAAARKTLAYRGHLSHPVGMAVHDVGNYWAKPLEPGIVFALDPQMWVPEEEVYIRVEDTVAVTSDGVENLTSLAPLELDDVENIIGTVALDSGGLL